MDAIEERLIRGFDELNRLDYKRLTAKTVESEFAEILEEAYIAGFASAAYILGETPDINVSKLAEALSKRYDGETIYEKARSYIKSENELKRLFESEFHRAFCQGELDMAASVKGVRKTWRTMKDNKVRDTHEPLEGITVPLDAEYTTFDGDKAKHPGGFANAENNANCRCYLTFQRI